MKTYLITNLYALIILLSINNAKSQYSLESVLIDVKNNAPISNLFLLYQQETDINNTILGHNLLPQIAVSGQATYQSETTGLNLDFPGVNIPRLSKDQYKIQADISQLLYDGGLTSMMKQLKQSSSLSDQNTIAQEIEILQTQSINIYFGILELELRQKMVSLKEEDVLKSINKLEAGVLNGVILKATLQNLQAEKIVLNQQQLEIKYMIAAQREALYLLTGNEKAKNASFNNLQSKVINSTLNPKSNSMYQFDILQQNIALKDNLDKISLRPRLLAFGQLGYGKPALNFLQNQFDPYYIVGLKTQWDLSKFYNTKSTKQQNLVQRQKLETKKEALKKSILLKNTQLLKDVEKLNAYASQDDEMISIRNQIKETANVQLENGTITSTEYLIKLNDTNTALLNKELHQLLLTKATYLINHNNGWNSNN